MRVEPARIDQLRRGTDGRMVLIDADVGGVAADLKALDPHLKVRFAENGRPPFWAVYWESEDKRSTYLVLTAQAHLTGTGVWSGLDQRVVDRVREIDGHGRSGYDFAKEVERANVQARERERKERIAKLELLAEPLAHAARKDLGVRYRGRTFVPREVPNAES